MCIFYLGTWWTIRYKKPQIGFRYLTCLHQWLLDQYVIVVFRLIQNTCMYIFDLRGYLYWSVAVIHGTGTPPPPPPPPQGAPNSVVCYFCHLFYLMSVFFIHIFPRNPPLTWILYVSLYSDILFDPLVLWLQNTFKLCVVPIFRYWAYLIKVIPETRRAH